MDLHAWGRQRAQYSRARRRRNERGASLGECALIQAVTQAMALRRAAHVGELARARAEEAGAAPVAPPAAA